MNENKGFFGSLFDLSFSEFVTTKIIKFLFIIAVIASAIGAIAVIAGGFAKSIALGILMLVLSPVIFLIYVIIARIYLEIVIVIFRIAENTGMLVKRDENKQDFDN
ncbi:MAG: DUF4282 domain-containing protein [Candidatus Krumholzibacteriota bacterium]|nr:DUF4282 domain-containing protein [Candidatus Krumholzibacteriota bacterium]